MALPCGGASLQEMQSASKDRPTVVRELTVLRGLRAINQECCDRIDSFRVLNHQLQDILSYSFFEMEREIHDTLDRLLTARQAL